MTRRELLLQYLRTRQAIARGQLWGIVLMAAGLAGMIALYLAAVLR